MTNSTYVGRIGSTRALAQIFTVTACYQCFPTVESKFVVTSFECFGVSGFIAAVNAEHKAREISLAETDTHLSPQLRMTRNPALTRSSISLTLSPIVVKRHELQTKKKDVVWFALPPTLLTEMGDVSAWRAFFGELEPPQPKREVGPYSSRISARLRDAWCRGIRTLPPRAATGRPRSGRDDQI
jgi:hypothetical protein